MPVRRSTPIPAQALDRLLDAYSAQLALLRDSPPLSVEVERALARRMRDARRPAADRRAAREALWQANLRLCWRVVTRVEPSARAREARLDLFQTVALALWQKTLDYDPDRTGAGGRLARFGTYVMPTLRSAASRAQIAAQPVRRPVWVVARERQAALRVSAELRALDLTWDDLTPAEAEARMLAALEAIADDLRQSLVGTLAEVDTLDVLDTVDAVDTVDELADAVAPQGAREGMRTRAAHVTHVTHVFSAVAVLAHPPVEVADASYLSATSSATARGGRRYGTTTPPYGSAAGIYARRVRQTPDENDPLELAYARSVEHGWASDPYAAETPSADAVAERGGMFDALSPETAALVAQLDERAREALRLRFEQGLSQARIGELLGCTRARVGQILEDALATLRALDRAGGGKLRALAAPRQPTHD